MTSLALGRAAPEPWKPEGAYRYIVIPALQAAGLLPAGEIIRAEGTSQDARLGIDWIISGRDGTQHTLAARCQWNVDYGDLTIRYRTERGNHSELTKRALSIRNGGTYPGYTTQAYVDKTTGELLNAYVVGTRDLYEHVVRIGDDDEHFTLCACAAKPRWSPGGAQYIPVAISEAGRIHAGTRSSLIACGVRVGVLRSIDEGRGLWR